MKIRVRSYHDYNDVEDEKTLYDNTYNISRNHIKEFEKELSEGMCDNNGRNIYYVSNTRGRKDRYTSIVYRRQCWDTLIFVEYFRYEYDKKWKLSQLLADELYNMYNGFGVPE